MEEMPPTADIPGASGTSIIRGTLYSNFGFSIMVAELINFK
jgi:hypothetical protein